MFFQEMFYLEILRRSLIFSGKGQLVHFEWMDSVSLFPMVKVVFPELVMERERPFRLVPFAGIMDNRVETGLSGAYISGK